MYYIRSAAVTSDIIYIIAVMSNIDIKDIS
jgi:hypothetical protein